MLSPSSPVAHRNAPPWGASSFGPILGAKFSIDGDLAEKNEVNPIGKWRFNGKTIGKP